MHLASWLYRKIYGARPVFKVGDRVHLKVGGPLMNVIHVYSSRKMSAPLIECQWFEGKMKRINLFCEKSIERFEPA